MEKFNYNLFEQFYIYPQHIDKYNLTSHLHDTNAILKNNLEDYSKLKTKKYYYFKIPFCGHPNFISLTEFRKKFNSGKLESLCCRLCKWLIGSNISYNEFTKLYSINNQKPLSNVKIRNDEVIFVCPDCLDETQYNEMRWVLDHLRNGESFNSFCRGKCYSLGNKYPTLIPLWDEKRHNISIFSLSASDFNLYHRKVYFYCVVCGEDINTSMTVYNAVKNSPRCSTHKVKPSTSFAEMAIFFSFFRCLSRIPYIEILHKFKFCGNREFDIYIIVNKNYFFAIEVDGIHHKNTINEDESKNQFVQRNTFHLKRP